MENEKLNNEDLSPVRVRYKILRPALIAAIAISVLIFFLYLVPFFQTLTLSGTTKTINSFTLKKDPAYRRQINLLKRDIQLLSSRYGRYTSGQAYLVINTTDNLFYLYRNRKLVREGHCSTGSFKLLKTEEGRSWIFKTPKGKFTILGKTTNPSWKKPDWAFIEEGLPVPSADHHSRFEYGVLGEYALSLGDGYLIHGTIYKRFLGMPVTHGCVRMNDEDLEAVFYTLNIGSKVYIF
ncbi:MAG TPA: L,D-transpeptidase family protein [Bacteroidales bacterium]|nr:L,D-transpeptidase family protein [Bacteroidales bacterium]HPF04202.1 L,D-transpeptidase family protein [Bacteroidales bacterium]HPJ60898.1 L,D-transpeptidase family protein [Bacteroidales bacterium]HPR13663.1 L,D-transpeptidase family protein [Bacteroidales bacterium]HRW84346.1 L,D-transpeptidase family protein [Bacteroidales bacterium]